MNAFAKLVGPVSDALPCGPAPESIADLENFIATAEGQLPASYLTFSRTGFDAAGPLKDIETWLEQIRDLRLLVLAAKYFILSGNIAGFADAVETVSSLLAERWDDVHPQRQDESFTLRGAYVGSLDDMPTVVLPLQYAPLIKDKRLGPLAYRTHLVATKAAPPRNGEVALDAGAIRDALMGFEDFDGLKALHGAMSRTQSGLKTIRSSFIDKSGYDDAPSFDRLSPLVDAIAEYLGGIVAERDPAAVVPAEPSGDEAVAEPVPGAAAPVAVTAPQSAGDVAAALKAVESYFAVHEPSNPALLLVRQAQQMVGKSFVEALLLLAPAAAEKSVIKVGGDSPFSLSFAQLKALAIQGAGSAPVDATAAQTYTVTTRADATRLMSAVETYFRRVEPSSPIPLLIERARFFVDKDFPALLKDILKLPAG